MKERRESEEIMSITIIDKTVIVQETDAYGRALSWRYHKGQCSRTASVSLNTGLAPELKTVPESTFAQAFWRNWKQERGL